MTKEELVNRLLSIDRQISTRSWITAGGDLGELIDELQKEINREPSPTSKLDETVEQKNAEWSENDELNFNQAIYVCHQYGYSGVETWLKSLRQKMKGK